MSGTSRGGVALAALAGEPGDSANARDILGGDIAGTLDPAFVGDGWSAAGMEF